jgi:hypothetical protein
MIGTVLITNFYKVGNNVVCKSLAGIYFEKIYARSKYEYTTNIHIIFELLQRRNGRFG